MGMFKDIRDLHKMSKQYKRPTLREGLSQANQMMQQFQQGQELAQDLAVSGVPGQATVKAIRDTGAFVNEMPVLELDLSVNAGGFTSDVTHKQAVPHSLLGRLEPGATIPCKVDPTDHSKLLV